MSAERKVTVDLTEAEARALYQHLVDTPHLTSALSEAGVAIRAALPSEHPEGMRADVTTGGSVSYDFGVTTVHLGAVRRDGKWVKAVNADGRAVGHLAEDMVVKVEPIRVLADDEIAVKRSNHDGCANWRNIAHSVSVAGYGLAAGRCDAYADALDAEAQS